MPTPVRGFYVTPANNPDYNASAPGVKKDGNSTTLDAIFGTFPMTVAGAITVKEGTVVVPSTVGGILALTLIAPTAGLPSAGGDDGKKLELVSLAPFAHTLTTPANAINGNKHIATFAGTAPIERVSLFAYNGIWYVSASIDITLS